MTFRSAIDQLERFQHSEAVGAYFGLVRRKYLSEQIDRTGSDQLGGRWHDARRSRLGLVRAQGRRRSAGGEKLSSVRQAKWAREVGES